MPPRKATSATADATAAASRPTRARKSAAAVEPAVNGVGDMETKPKGVSKGKTQVAPKTAETKTNKLTTTTKKTVAAKIDERKASTKKSTAKKPTKKIADEDSQDELMVNGYASEDAKAPKVDENSTKTTLGRKRRSDDADVPLTKKRARTQDLAAAETEESTKRAVARRKAVPKAPTSTRPRAPRVTAIINHAPTQIVDVYVFGTGENGELGLGNGKNCTIVKRPRLNPHLAADKVGVVQVAVGGMHTAVLTKDNKILTWGVNDQGALGRDTTWDGGLKDVDADDSDSDSDAGENLNPKECVPGEVDLSSVPDGMVWTQIVASDSATFALTNTGLVYGCGTFRKNEGLLGFFGQKDIQKTLALIPALRKITKLAAGADHILALANTGVVYAWGAGQQNQLARRMVADHDVNGLVPTSCGLPKAIVNLGAGSYHSFAVHKNGTLYGWGLNSFGEAGLPKDFDDQQSPDANLPQPVPGLESFGTITQIEGGAHHTIALTDKNEILVWGRLDGSQLGIDISSLPDEAVIKDSNNNKRILRVPTKIAQIKGTSVAAGTDHSLVVSTEGKAYSTGFSASFQTGQGTDEDVEMFEVIDNTAVREKKLVFSGCGGQFSVLAGLADIQTHAQAQPQVNGA